MEKELVEQKLAAFSVKTLRAVQTVHLVLENEGITFGELEEFLEELRMRAKTVSNKSIEEMRKREEEVGKQFAEWQEKVRKCPLCNAPLTLSKISTLRGKANREGWRSFWSCPSEECLFEEYSKEYADKIYTETMED